MARPTVTLEWLPAQGPGTADGSWADISTYLTDGSCQSGRKYELDRFAAGTATFTLKDVTRRFDPEWTSGAWYGQLVPMRQIRLKATWNAVTYNVWRGYITDWGQAVPAGDRLWVSTVTARDAFSLFEMMGLPGSWYELAVRDDEPAHWWRLDETSGDTVRDSGYATTLQTGLYVNAPILTGETVTTYDGGRQGVALDAINQYVTIPPAALPTSTTWSVEGWFQTSSFVFGGIQWCIFDAGTNGLDEALNVYVHGTSGLLEANWYTGLTGGVDATVTSVARVNDELPHHFVVTCAGEGFALTLYLDGVSVDTDTISSGANFSTVFHQQHCYIGCNRNNLDFFNGTIANISLYDGVVLSSTQVGKHYDAGANAFSGDDTGAMIARVLDYKAFPTSLQDLDTGASLVGSYDLTAANVAEYIQQMADTEAGATYISPDGKLTHRSRTALYTETRSTTSQATFGDRNGSATLNYVAEAFALTRDEALIRNPVSASRPGGLTYTARDATYITKYGERGWAAPASYTADEDEIVDRAHALLGRYKELGTRLENIRIMPDRSGTLLYPQVLGRLIGDRITVTRKPLNTGNETSVEQIIEAVRHAFTPHLWVTEWTGSPPDTAEYALYTDGVLYDDGTVYAF